MRVLFRNIPYKAFIPEKGFRSPVTSNFCHDTGASESFACFRRESHKDHLLLLSVLHIPRPYKSSSKPESRWSSSRLRMLRVASRRRSWCPVAQKGWTWRPLAFRFPFTHGPPCTLIFLLALTNIVHSVRPFPPFPHSS